MFLVNN